MPTNLNQELLTAALEGLEVRKQRIDEQISEVRSLLRTSGTTRSADTEQSASQTRHRKPLSAAARKRIAAAQRKRWAAVKKAAAASEKPGAKPQKRKAAKKMAVKKAAPKKAAVKKAAVKSAAAGGESQA